MIATIPTQTAGSVLIRLNACLDPPGVESPPKEVLRRSYREFLRIGLEEMHGMADIYWREFLEGLELYGPDFGSITERKAESLLRKAYMTQGSLARVVLYPNEDHGQHPWWAAYHLPEPEPELIDPPEEGIALERLAPILALLYKARTPEHALATLRMGHEFLLMVLTELFPESFGEDARRLAEEMRRHGPGYSDVKPDWAAGVLGELTGLLERLYHPSVG